MIAILIKIANKTKNYKLIVIKISNKSTIKTMKVNLNVNKLSNNYWIFFIIAPTITIIVQAMIIEIDIIIILCMLYMFNYALLII
jgi:hypothetical protein